jgi:DNA-binding MarR family transcriptional regulator
MTFLSNPFFLDFILFFTTKILLTLLFRKQKNNIMKEKEGVEMDKRQLLIEEYLDLANEIIHRNKPEMEKEFAGFTLNELEVIEHIGKIPDPNVTKLANASYMTRGAISKLTKKLIARGIINTYQSEENKKEIYFQLTPIGQKIKNRHEQLHQKWVQRDAAVKKNMTQYFVLSVDTENLYGVANETNVLYCNNNRQRL